ncbi:hypothetical protein GYMLUDRAFT_247684 [Collybiopsis luxurians FD-317 M1]|uniref:Uncharacterized protein n=1 Tax=Collybiopsis luxurians FD-317 M1 TaxID=944289 RepID=A0A0D0CF08_9AGAR|nr:hypothetical protein GYMLUDRAFT_247684 [Collybiopsis luxurians FD-317 M1]
MSRPRKYHTAAQLRAAKQKYNASHYQKHRETIVRKRQKKYRRDKRKLERAERKERKLAREYRIKSRASSKSFQKSAAGKALVKASDLKAQYLKLIHNNLPPQLKEIVQHYLGIVTGFVTWRTSDPEEAARSHFEVPHGKITDLLTAVEECSRTILSQCGPAEEWLECHKISEEMRQGLSLWEDVMCHALEGTNVLREAFFK